MVSGIVAPKFIAITDHISQMIDVLSNTSECI
jgi:hypothetical protein